MISNIPRHKSLAMTLVSAPLDPLQSSLQIGSGGGIEKLLLDLIYCQRMKTRQDLNSFVVCTLMNVQHPPHLVSQLFSSFPLKLHLSSSARSRNGSRQPSHFYSNTSSSSSPPAPSLFPPRPPPSWGQQPHLWTPLFKSEQLHSAVRQLCQGSLPEMP
jgi:hypothetical protein